MEEEFGPWIVWGKQERPAGLRDGQRIKAVFINGQGELLNANTDRSVAGHAWDRGVTLAYRVMREEKTHVVYGAIGGGWDNCNFLGGDTHKITYVVDGAGEVMSCKMEKL